MQDWIDGHRKEGVQPVFANPSRTVVRQLNSAGLQDIIGPQFIVVRMADAVRLCQVRTLNPMPHTVDPVIQASLHRENLLTVVASEGA